MLRFSPKLLLVGTAFAPVLMVSAAVEYLKASCWKEGLERSWWLLALSVTLVALCVLVMNRVQKSLPPQDVEIKSIKPADKELVGFVLAYLLPIARGSTFDTGALVIVLAIFFLVVLTSNAYHTNPLLGLLGWHFYEVVIEDVGYILISRKNIHNVKKITRVTNLTDYMVADVTPRNEPSSAVRN